MLSILMQDIYPGPKWNYVFGWANYKARTGVFSFARYDPSFYGNTDSDVELKLLSNSCYVMVHEIGHMFGMLHCINYECIMNGFNSEVEQNRRLRCNHPIFDLNNIVVLCPVCQRKL